MPPVIYSQVFLEHFTVIYLFIYLFILSFLCSHCLRRCWIFLKPYYQVRRKKKSKNRHPFFFFICYPSMRCFLTLKDQSVVSVLFSPFFALHWNTVWFLLKYVAVSFFFYFLVSPPPRFSTFKKGPENRLDLGENLILLHLKSIFYLNFRKIFNKSLKRS